MNPQTSNGSPPTRTGKLGLDVASRTASGQEIPTLRIQAGTPIQSMASHGTTPQHAAPQNATSQGYTEKGSVLPSIPSAQTSPRQPISSNGQTETSQKPPVHVFATPQVPAPPTTQRPSQTSPRNIKRDIGNGYGPQCIGYNAKTSMVQTSTGVRLEPLYVSLKLPNTLLQNQSPTPSDVSSIRLTPRNNILSPCLSDRNSVMTPRSPKVGFLEPKLPIKQEWSAYKVLPGLNNSHHMMDSHGFAPPFTPNSAYSHYGGSSNSLSPFPNFEMSPSASSFASPRHSALSFRMAKKRALSVSPLSTEGLDLNHVIRTSPTSLVAYINGSRGSSTNVSPLPLLHGGALTHQPLSSSRPGSGNNRYNSNTFKKEHEVPYYQMGNLEQNTLNSQAFDQNHLVMPADNVQYMEQNHVYKQEPVDLYSQPTAQMPPTSQRPPVHPPPSYQQAVQNKGENYNGEVTEEGEKQLICRWIDCNQIFNEQDELVRHIEKVHIDQRKGEDFTCFWHSCPRQYKPFNARYKLLIHMRVHSGEKPNKCTFENCNKAFSRLENLKIHLRSHTGERPYVCQQPSCNKAFSNSSDRAKHQRTHLDTKPYACTVMGCNKRYTDPSSLRKHHKTHTQKEQQQARKKMRSNKDEVFSNDISLNDCLQICSLRPGEGSPMSMNSPHSSHCGSHPGSSSDMYPGANFTQTGYHPANPTITYSSNHSSRSGTATGLSSRPSPASVQGSPMGQHVAMEDCSDARTMNNFNSPMISPGRRPLPPIMADQRKPMSGGAPSPHVSPRQGLPPPAYQQMPTQTMGGYQPPYDMVPQQAAMPHHYPEYMQNNTGQGGNKFYEIQLVQQANQQMNESQINVNYMMMPQPNPRNLMQIPTFEEGLKSITTLSNHSGFSDPQNYDMMYNQPEMENELNNNQFLQLNHQVDRCNSQLSAV